MRQDLGEGEDMGERATPILRQSAKAKEGAKQATLPTRPLVRCCPARRLSLGAFPSKLHQARLRRYDCKGNHGSKFLQPTTPLSAL